MALDLPMADAIVSSGMRAAGYQVDRTWDRNGGTTQHRTKV